jgi:uncharacterized repeat protein (TIGR01451 family)
MVSFVVATSPIMPPGVDTITNVVRIGGIVAPGVTGTAVSTDTTPILPVVLQISKRADPPSGSWVAMDSLITYTLVVTNMSASAASNLLVADAIPQGTTMLAGSDLPLAQSTLGALIWMAPQIGARQTLTLSFVARVTYVPGLNVITNTASVRSDQTPTQYSNETVHFVTTSPTAIDLAGLAATRLITGTVMLAWTMSDEANTAGYYVYRSEGNDAARAAPVSELIQARGMAGQNTRYTWSDDTALPGTAYTYWIGAVTYNGDVNVMWASPAFVADVAWSRVYLPVASR